MVCCFEASQLRFNSLLTVTLFVVHYVVVYSQLVSGQVCLSVEQEVASSGLSFRPVQVYRIRLGGGFKSDPWAAACVCRFTVTVQVNTLFFSASTCIKLGRRDMELWRVWQRCNVMEFISVESLVMCSVSAHIFPLTNTVYTDGEAQQNGLFKTGFWFQTTLSLSLTHTCFLFFIAHFLLPVSWRAPLPVLRDVQTVVLQSEDILFSSSLCERSQNSERTEFKGPGYDTTFSIFSFF